MRRDEVSEVVNQTIDQVIERDHELLDLGVTERALAHQLAVKLQALIPAHYYVDCEYNRHLRHIRKLQLPHRDALDSDVRARTVYPDIVVHRRNTHDDNLLVLELNKPGEALDYDQLKLLRYRESFHCEHAGTWSWG